MERTKRVTVLYDGDCGFCRWVTAWLVRWDRRHRLNVEPIQGSAGSTMLADLAPQERLRSWHCVDELGNRASGGAAFPFVFQVLPGGVPLARLARSLPGAVDGCYRFVAGRRRCWGRLLPRRSIERADSVIRGREARK